MIQKRNKFVIHFFIRTRGSFLLKI